VRLEQDTALVQDWRRTRRTSKIGRPGFDLRSWVVRLSLKNVQNVGVRSCLYMTAGVDIYDICS
jgi:hypothetical protein